uniref:Signal transducer and activator of transcription n=1 Tax=Syphacia muris TaxID=451379 RepID=A0A158R3S0_9BILA
MLGYMNVKAGLCELANECKLLWEENKDMQGRFVNDLTELQRTQIAIHQLEIGNKVEKLSQARMAMEELQSRATKLYEKLTEKRCMLVDKLTDGVHNVAILQNQLISERLYDWKNRQKLSQVGVPFDDRDQLLDDIQADFELLAEQNWQLRAFASWQLDLLRRGPQLTDNIAQMHITRLSSILDNMTKLLCMLVPQSFVVAVQPESVLKTQHKFVSEVRLLIGDKLGIKQHLVNTNVTVKIIAEDEARMLSTAQISEKEIKSVGSISNDFEKLTMDEKHHMTAKFTNSKLTRIAHRKPPAKVVQTELKGSMNNIQTATDQRYALLFHISPFQLGNLGKFDVWTLSLPLMVTVHGSQDCDAQGSILWQRAFSNNRSAISSDIKAVSWSELANILRHKFTLYTGARRGISDSDLNYMAEKFMVTGTVDNKPITFQRFAKENLRDDVNFSFWEWLFAIMQLIKQKLLKFWDEGWLVGFISKQDASTQMVNAPHATFLLRFSDTQTGAVSIGFVCEDDGSKGIPFHLSPFSIKDLDQLSLAQRIASCPQLKEIRFLYPDIDKEEMLRHFDTEERQKSRSPTGYIQSEIVMVAKTNSSTYPVGESPSSISNNSKLDWSPTDGVHRSNSMDILGNEELISLLSNNNFDNSVEALLGPGFHPQLPTQPLQTCDLSFIDSAAESQFHVGADDMEE